MVPSISILVSVLLRPGGGSAHTHYYRDKTIRLVAGAPAGSVYDLYARLVAQFIGKEIIAQPPDVIDRMKQLLGT